MWRAAKGICSRPSSSGGRGREGDLFGELDARADVYTMKWILHDWGDDACRGILTRLRATMPSGAKVVTIDPHHERTRPDGLTPMMDLLMLVCCEGGRERSPQEVHALPGSNPGGSGTRAS